MTTQACPNCGHAHDVRVYVSGQKVLCGCGIRFEVARTDVDGGRREADRSSSKRANQSEPVEQTFVASSRLEIPGYQLRELLGKGGMGEVWRAVQQSLGREVAIKILPANRANDAEFVARFHKEAAALAALSHPNIIQIIDRGVSQGHYYFVMEFIAGRSLRELLDRGPIDPADALKIVAQLCRAIDYAHEKQIVHRDVKPENILIDEQGHVKVADFGLAGMQQAEGEDHLTATAMAMGTVNYMAPEQRRDAHRVDGRADLYSVGVIFYELLTRELPFGRFKLPSQRLPGLDPRLDPIVAKLLESEPEARYPRGSALAAQLEPLLGSGDSGRWLVPKGAGGTSPVGVRGRKGSSAGRLVLEKGWRGVRIGLMALGALAIAAFLVRQWIGRVRIQVAKSDGSSVLVEPTDVDLLQLRRAGHLAGGKHAGNTDGELFASATWRELPGGRGELLVDFEEGTEEINAHSGRWSLESGTLRATQAGSETAGQKLVPRAYVAHRYFSSDDFVARVDLTVRALEPDYPVEEGAQHFGELAFRIKDLQISAVAVDGVGMRLVWRFLTPSGAEISGNSSKDLEDMVEDEMPVPPDGTTFNVKLSLKKHRLGTEIEGFVNGQRFAKKILPGLQGRAGKIALGCRNLHCEFDNLNASGKLESRPQLTQIAEVE